MRTEIFIDNEHSYYYTHKKGVHTLWYSEMPEWSHPGTIALQVKDTGNGYKFKQLDKNNLYPHVTLEMYILFKFIFAAEKIEIAKKEKI